MKYPYSKNSISLLLSLILLLNYDIYAQEKPVDLVYPHLDATNSRWLYFSSACRPFGMVNLSPDTEVGGAWGSGYRYDIHEIKGFSHVHAWQLSALSVMPVNGKVQEVKNDFYSDFSHENEVVAPGYHKVELERFDITAELTSTTRVGFHRYTFKNNNDRSVLIRLHGPNGPCEITEGKITKISSRELSGYVMNAATRRRPKETPVFFYIEVNRPVKELLTWKGDQIMEKSQGVEGAESGALLVFGNEPDEPALMKVGISYTNEEKARKNIEAELTHWDFEKVVADSKEEWNSPPDTNKLRKPAIHANSVYF